MPRIVVACAAYNAEPFVARGLKSVLNQTFQDFEIHIVDDGSTDDTRRVIEGLDSRKVTIIPSETNEGLPLSLNKVISKVDCQYVARFDVDDVCHPLRFERQMEFFRANADVGICGTYVFTRNEGTGAIDFGNADSLGLTAEEVRVNTLMNSPYNHPSVMFNLGALDRSLLTYHTEYIPAGDYELWTRIRDRAKGVNIPEFLYLYSVSNTQISTQRAKEQVEKGNLLRRRNLWFDPIDPHVFEAHCAVANGNARYLIANPKNVADWFRILIQANSQSRIFDPAVLRGSLIRRLVRIVRSAPRDGTPSRGFDVGTLDFVV